MILDLHRQGCQRLGHRPPHRARPQDRAQIHRARPGAAGLRPPPAAGRRSSRRSSAICASALAAFPELTGRRLQRELRELGYAGGYTT